MDLQNIVPGTLLCVLFLQLNLVVISPYPRIEPAPRLRNFEGNTCQSGFLDGVCRYALECYNEGKYAREVCRKGFQFGVCCTNTTTLSPFVNDISFPESNIDCGRVPLFFNFSSRIANGDVAMYANYPWTVSIRVTIDGNDKLNPFLHVCGATLVHHLWVITSGHCVTLEPSDLVYLRFGEYDSSTLLEPHGHMERTIAEVVFYPGFDINSYDNDIALVKLNRPVIFQPNIQPICLPGNDGSLVGRVGEVSGWGRMQEEGGPSNIINMVSLPILSNDECESMFKRGSIRETISDNFLCAGFEHGLADACTGDSGGPLQVKGEDGRFFLAGVVSWGYGCSRPLKPGVYVRVSKFVPWILRTISQGN